MLRRLKSGIFTAFITIMVLSHGEGLPTLSRPVPGTGLASCQAPEVPLVLLWVQLSSGKFCPAPQKPVLPRLNPGTEGRSGCRRGSHRRGPRDKLAYWKQMPISRLKMSPDFGLPSPTPIAGAGEVPLFPKHYRVSMHLLRPPA